MEPCGAYNAPIIPLLIHFVRTFNYTHALPLSVTHTHTLSLSFFYSFTLSLSLTHTHTHTNTRLHALNVVVNFGHIEIMSDGTMTDAKILITHASEDLQKWTRVTLLAISSMKKKLTIFIL